MVLHARVVLDLCEHLEKEIRFEQVEGDFDAFRGKWILEKLGSNHTLLKYSVDSKMHRNCFLSEAIMEEVCAHCHCSTCWVLLIASRLFMTIILWRLSIFLVHSELLNPSDYSVSCPYPLIYMKFKSIISITRRIWFWCNVFLQQLRVHGFIYSESLWKVDYLCIYILNKKSNCMMQVEWNVLILVCLCKAETN